MNRDGRDIYIAIDSPRPVVTGKLYQYDYGQILHFTGVTLPEAYEVHFSHSTTGEAKTVIGNEDGVLIPDEYLLSGEDIVVWVYLHATEDDGETKYTCRIPVVRRAKPIDTEPTPVQQDTITQAIAALQRAATETAADAEDASQSAEAAAQSASNAAQSESNAHASAGEASAYCEEAEKSAIDARDSAESALASAEASQQSAETSEFYADKAEQVAHEAGYMFFHIDELGQLIYTKCNSIDVDFWIDSDGNLVLGEVS